MNSTFLAWSNHSFRLAVLLFGLLVFHPSPTLATDTPMKGNVQAGQAIRAECPIGSFLVGFAGRTGAWIDRMAPVCEPLSADKQRLGKFTMGPMIGTSTGGKPDHIQCPANTIIRVTVNSVTVGDEGQVKFVESIHPECFTTAGAYVVGQPYMFFGTPTDRANPDLSSKPLDDRLDCPPGEFARGFNVRAGEFINAFGLICGPLVPRLPGTGLPADASKTTSAFPTAPRIDSPTPNGVLVKGKGVFKITPSKYLTGTHAQYQLRWLNPPASSKGKGQDFYNQEISLGLIANPTGLPVPQTLLAQGIWEIRVRINRPQVGDWSDWVRFTYYLQNPALGTAAQDAQNQDLQFGVGGQQKTMSGNSGTRPYRPQMTPQQGMGETMLIRPRGVEGKDDTRSNEAVDTSPEIEKKP